MGNSTMELMMIPSLDANIVMLEFHVVILKPQLLLLPTLAQQVIGATSIMKDQNI